MTLSVGDSDGVEAIACLAHRLPVAFARAVVLIHVHVDCSFNFISLTRTITSFNVKVYHGKAPWSSNSLL